MKKILKKQKDKSWHWPYLRYSDGPEWQCRHGVGHSVGVHGCDGKIINGQFIGCCNDSKFPGKKLNGKTKHKS